MTHSGYSLLAKNLAAAKRMVLEARPPLVVEVVQERNDAPARLVLAKLPRVAAHGRLHRQRVLQETLALGVLREQLPGVVAIRSESHLM